MGICKEKLAFRDEYLCLLNYNDEKQKLKNRIRSSYGNIFSQEDVNKYLKENLKRKNYIKYNPNENVIWEIHWGQHGSSTKRI